MQYAARNEFQAKKRFEYSCEQCCARGIKVKCESCAINAAHDHMISAFADKKAANALEWIHACQHKG